MSKPICPTTGKISHPTYHDAAIEWESAVAARTNASVKTEKRIYRCVYCEGFHLTSEGRPGRRL